MSNAAPSPYLQGNFAPVAEETQGRCELIEGALPKRLRGHFLRIGPNPLYVADPARYHWFDGDGMIHQVLFDADGAHYRNRFIQTDGYRAERKHGGWLWPGLNSVAMERLAELEERYGSAVKNVANTAFVYHDEHLMALWEAGNPHRIGLPELQTLGEWDYGGALQHPFSAHPKVDATTGEMVVFGYSGFPPYCRYSLVGSDGRICHQVAVDMPRGVMMHDCAITENHVVLMDFPVCFSLERILAGGDAFAWEPGNGSRIGVLPRRGEEVRWFEIDNGMVFHTANAWENDDGTLSLLACRSDYSNVLGDAIEGAGSDRGRMYHWTLDLNGGRVEGEELDRIECDFPRINESLVGQPSRYTWVSVFEGGDRMPKFSGVSRYDHQRRGRVDHHHGDGRIGGEMVFVPDPEGRAEDDGWLLGFIHDENSDSSECLVLDAHDLSPLARLATPARVPYGFHAGWVAS